LGLLGRSRKVYNILLKLIRCCCCCCHHRHRRLETRLDTSPHLKPGYNHNIRPENRPDFKHWKHVVPINRNRVASHGDRVMFWMGDPNDWCYVILVVSGRCIRPATPESKAIIVVNVVDVVLVDTAVAGDSSYLTVCNRSSLWSVQPLNHFDSNGFVNRGTVLLPRLTKWDKRTLGYHCMFISLRKFVFC
jgi:hypothetical protein